MKTIQVHVPDDFPTPDFEVERYEFRSAKDDEWRYGRYGWYQHGSTGPHIIAIPANRAEADEQLDALGTVEVRGNPKNP